MCPPQGAWRNTPARAIEPERLGDAPPPVEKHIDVAVHRIEPKASYGTGKGIERAVHVEALNDDEHAHRWRPAQHARRTRTIFRSVSTAQVSSNSTRTSPLEST